MSKPHQIVKNGLSLTAFFKRYPTDSEAESQFETWRWPDGPTCPHCTSTNIAAVAARRPMPYRCRTCRKHFSVKSHTVMHDSKLGGLWDCQKLCVSGRDGFHWMWSAMRSP